VTTWPGGSGARELLATHPDIATASIHTMAAVGDVTAAAALLADDPGQASAPGGPHDWEPLLYLAYSRLDSTAAGHSTLEVARVLLASGADPQCRLPLGGNLAPEPRPAVTSPILLSSRDAGSLARGEARQPGTHPGSAASHLGAEGAKLWSST
jgi:hypothetical protein